MALLNSPVFARQPRVGRSVGLLVAGAIWVAGGMPASAQATRAPEYSVKAAYLYNFTHFIEWPSNSFAAPDARMNAAYIRVGVGGCDMGSGYLLPRLIGLSVASELLLTGRFLNADRAKTVGLVSDVVPDDKLLETGLAFAAEMTRASPMGLRLTKQTLNALIDAPGIDAALMIEDRQQVILLETSDHREAVAAFRERRDPSYSDR